MTDQKRVLELYDRANPVQDPEDIINDVEAASYLAVLKERSSGIQELSTYNRPYARSPVTRWLVAAAVLLVGILVILTGQIREDSSPAPVADQPPPTFGALSPLTEGSVISADPVGRELLSRVTSDLRVQTALGSDGTQALSSISPSGELEVIDSFEPGEWVSISVDASNDFLFLQSGWSPPSDDIRNELWAGPVGGEQWLLASDHVTAAFHPTKPGMIVYTVDVNGGKDWRGFFNYGVYTADLSEGPGSSRQVATVTLPSDHPIPHLTNRGILLTGPGFNAFFLTPGGEQIEIERQIDAVTPDGKLLSTTHSVGVTRLLDPITKSEEVLVDWGEWAAAGGWLHWVRWLPGHEAFFFFSADAEEARLVDASGATKARIGLAPNPSSVPPGAVFEWDDLILFSGERMGSTYQIWDPATGQTGLVEFEVGRIMLPLPTYP